VPVIAHTCRPSVTGDGDDMFCFCIRVLPPPSGRFQRTAPRARSMDHSDRLRPSATLRKMRSPQTMGVEPDHSGSGSFQAIFSVFDQRTGRFVSALRPFSSGPRHCGQFSAVSGATPNATSASTNTPDLIRSGPLLL
jgi:hypothetical protein